MEKDDLVLKISNIEFLSIPIGDIDVEDRFREDLGDIDSLAASISKEGLIQPVAVCRNTSGKPFRLLAGGRRYAAVSHIAETDGLTTISCRVYPGELREVQRRMLEYAENLYRKDMTWQEADRLKRRIYELQQTIHGKKTSTTPGAPGFSLTDMAKMTGNSKGSLSESISLAKMMDETPGINWDGFKTRSDAVKAIKGAKKVVKQSEDAKIAVKAMGEGDTRKKKLINSYRVLDFFDGVKKIGNGTMDFVEIDPPYGINLENIKKDYDYSGYNEVSPKDYPEFMLKVFRESYRVLKPNSWLICWLAPEPWFEKIYQWLIDSNFQTKRMCGIWVKGVETSDGIVGSAQGQTMQADRVLANGYEIFFYARKGSPLLNRPGMSNVFGYKPIHPSLKVHPTERPIELIEDILTTFTAPNSNILVPFAGSGNTLIAAARQNMLPIGYDLTKEYQESYTIKIHKTFR